MTEEERKRCAQAWFRQSIERAYTFKPEDPGAYFAQEIGFPEATEKFRAIFAGAEREGDS